MRFKFPFRLIGKLIIAFSTDQSWHLLKSRYTGGDSEREFQRCFVDGLDQSLLSSVAQVMLKYLG